MVVCQKLSVLWHINKMFQLRALWAQSSTRHEKHKFMGVGLEGSSDLCLFKRTVIGAFKRIDGYLSLSSRDKQDAFTTALHALEEAEERSLEGQPNGLVILRPFSSLDKLLDSLNSGAVVDLFLGAVLTELSREQAALQLSDEQLAMLEEIAKKILKKTFIGDSEPPRTMDAGVKKTHWREMSLGRLNDPPDAFVTVVAKPGKMGSAVDFGNAFSVKFPKAHTDDTKKRYFCSYGGPEAGHYDKFLKAKPSLAPGGYEYINLVTVIRRLVVSDPKVLDSLAQVILTRAFGHGIQVHESLRDSVDLCKNIKSIARLIIENFGAQTTLERVLARLGLHLD